MTDHDRLLHAVLDAPDDDTPRLVYADWLEEQGGAEYSIRAKFIRAACELARLSWNDPARERLARLCEQYESRVHKWDIVKHPPFSPGHHQFEPVIRYDRGLPVLTWTVDSISFTYTLPNLPPGWAAEVALYGGNETWMLERLAERVTEWPDAVRVISMIGGGYRVPFTVWLTRLSPLFPRLTRLSVWGPSASDMDATAAATVRVPLLREVHLSADESLTTIGLRELVRGPLGEGLRLLKIGIGGLNPREQFPDLADRLYACPEPHHQPASWKGYNVPRVGRPPLLLVFDEDDIPF